MVKLWDRLCIQGLMVALCLLYAMMYMDSQQEPYCFRTLQFLWLHACLALCLAPMLPRCLRGLLAPLACSQALLVGLFFLGWRFGLFDMLGDLALDAAEAVDTTDWSEVAARYVDKTKLQQVASRVDTASALLRNGWSMAGSMVQLGLGLSLMAR